MIHLSKSNPYLFSRPLHISTSQHPPNRPTSAQTCANTLISSQQKSPDPLPPPHLLASALLDLRDDAPAHSLPAPTHTDAHRRRPAAPLRFGCEGLVQAGQGPLDRSKGMSKGMSTCPMEMLSALVPNIFDKPPGVVSGSFQIHKPDQL